MRAKSSYHHVDTTAAPNGELKQGVSQQGLPAQDRELGAGHGEEAWPDMPTTPRAWLQWGMSQMQAGYKLERAGASDSADNHYQSIIDELEERRAKRGSQVTNDVIAGVALRHGIRLVSFGKLLSAEAALLTALNVFESLLALDAHVGRVREIAQASSWLAVVRHRQGDLLGSRAAYEKSTRQWRSVVRFSGDREDRRRSTVSLSVSLRGYTKVLDCLGEELEASRASEEARLLGASEIASH